MASYPKTRTDDVIEELHGHRIADPYRWLEDPDSAETAAWITEQNALTDQWLSGVEQREWIRTRLTELWDHPRVSAPSRRGERWFQHRNTGLQNQDVLYRMSSAEGDNAEVLLDPNTLSEDGTVALVVAEPSHDGSLLAYSTSSAGSDWQTWRVLDVATGADRDDVLEWSKFSGAAWTHDGAGFYYNAYDAPEQGAEFEQRNDGERLQYHRLGTPQSADEVVLAWPDAPEWTFSAEVVADGRWLVVTVALGTERRTRLWAAPVGETPRPLIDEFDAEYQVAGTDGETLFVRTDLDADRGRIVAVDLTDPARALWREVVPQTDDTLQYARVIGGRLVALYLHDASHRIRLFELDGTPAGEVELGELASVEELTGHEDDDAFCFAQVGFTRSSTIRRHHLGTGRTDTLVEPALSLDGFVTEQVFVPSPDGTRVPVFLVHRDGLAATGDVPTMLYGYGGFDIALTPSCSVSWLVWLELGGLLAVANLRGGGEYGKDWYEAGRLDRKQNVFDDFAAAAEWLTGEGGWTRPARLAINGRSNGGLLVGACLTQRPELYGACVPEVGVFDMLRFHKFTIGWAWTQDYGSPDDPAQFETLLAYSPLHAVRSGTPYPPTLVVTGDHDDRVVPGHSLKFLAALQAAQGDPAAPVLLRVEVSAGHGAGTPTSKLIAARTDVLSFLAGTLGV